MARFLITFYVGDMAQDGSAVAEARQEFADWAAQAGGALADPGTPVRSARMISQSGIDRTQACGSFLGWVVIEATGTEEAAELLRGHPFVSRGGIVQLHEPV